MSASRKIHTDTLSGDKGRSSNDKSSKQEARLSCSTSSPNSGNSRVSTCDHCGLPVWTAQNHEGPVYCCYGCQMVDELQEKKDEDLDDFFLPTDLLARWVISFVFSMLLIFLSLTIHLEQQEPAFFHLLSLALSTAIWGILGREVLRTLKLEFINRSWSLASLIFIGSLASYLLSVYNLGLTLLANEAAETYFETSGMILSFYVGSILIDVYFKQKVRSYSETWEQKQQEILKETTSGNWFLTPSDSIQPGDHLKIHNGQNFPVDGTMVSEVGYVQESHLTGEEEPVLKKEGDEIRAGSIALDTEIVIRAVNTFQSSSLQNYLETYKSLSARPSRFEQLAQKAARYLLVTMISLASLVFLYYAWTGPLQTALNHTLAVLLIGCPCAFSIATPAALWIAQNKLHNAGVLLRTGSFALEQLSNVKHLFFDKTGTLTREAEPTSLRWLDREWSEREALAWSLMAGLEGEQYHPLAKAIRNQSRKRNIEPAGIKGITLLQGLGVKGHWQTSDAKHHSVKVINHLHSEGKEVLGPGEFALTIDQKPVLKFGLHFPLKEQVKKILNELSSMIKGELHVISGDPVPREELENQKWHYHGGLSPEQKAQYIRDIVSFDHEKERTAFIGDGLNDLMAMAETDVNIVMFEGAEISKNEADIVMYNPHISMVEELYYFAKRVRRILLTNFFWAIIFNLVGLTLAAAGALNPLMSIAAMILSSVLVTLNSLRLRRVLFSSANYKNKPF